MPKQDTDLDKWLQGLSRIVNEILWRDWDPMDINEDPHTTDVYEPLVPGVLRLLINDASPAEVADHLWHIEEEELKLSVSQTDTVDAANMLVNESHIYEDEHPRPNSIN